MNYLSHFYIHQKINNPYFNTGLILPDLARGYVKSFKRNKHSIVDPLMYSLNLGCLQHYAADSLFHNSPFFKWGTTICINEIKNIQFHQQVERRWFIGHVLFEMLLDRLLVRHQPQVINDFYKQLILVEQEAINNFFALNNAREKEKLVKLFNHFRTVKYIANYTNNNLFVYSLSRVLINAGLPVLCFSDKALLEDCVCKLEEEKFREVYSVLLLLKQVF